MTFPSTFPNFSRQTDGSSAMDAADVNLAYDEMEALASSTPASYVIYKISTTYYAKACFSGGTNYSGTVASTVIQSAIDALPAAGGKIYITTGTYDMTGRVRLPSNVTVEGAGSSTILKASDNAEWDSPTENAIFENKNRDTGDDHHIVIRNLQIDGNVTVIAPTTQTAKNPLSGIKLGWARDCVVENCEIHDVASFGIVAYGRTTSPPDSECVFRNNHIYNITYNANPVDGRISAGIFITNGVSEGCVVDGNIIQNCYYGIEYEDGADYGSIINNYLVECTNTSIFASNGGYNVTIGHNVIKDGGADGIDWAAGYRSSIEGNIIDNCTGKGINVGSTIGGTSISNNYVGFCDNAGIYVNTGGAQHTIVANTLEANGQNATLANKYQAGIYSASNEVTIVGNLFMDAQATKTQEYGVYDEGGGATAVITANRFQSHGTAAVVSTGGGRISNNSGYITENKGNSTIAAGTTAVTINHGCGFTPVAEEIFITPKNGVTNPPGLIYVSVVTATQFTVTCAADPGAPGLGFGWQVRRV